VRQGPRRGELFRFYGQIFSDFVAAFRWHTFANSGAFPLLLKLLRISFGQKIATLRKQKGLSQADLATKVGTIGVTIGRYERDEIKPSIDIAAKIADALDVSLYYMVGNSDELIDKNLANKVIQIQNLP
jgi:ribosome-binding protein aMBF1 (putative translation factor)